MHHIDGGTGLIRQCEFFLYSQRDREAVKLCQELKPDVLLLDLDMPDMDGLEVTRQVKDMVANTNILVISSPVALVILVGIVG